MKVAVLGAGSFGTSLAMVLAHNDHEVNIWSHSKDTADVISKKRENSIYLPGITLQESIQASHNMEAMVKGCDAVLSVVPTQATREVWKNAKKLIEPGRPIIVASKGIEQKTHLLVNEIMLDILGEEAKGNLFFLSGPSFAKELAEKKPTAITIAGYNQERIDEIQRIFFNKYFRAYGTNDVVGVELGGALKNIIALGTGISDGLGMGPNARAALITRGLAEIARLGKAKGADPMTFMGLAGLGDLVLTCTGDLSRNRQVGIRLAQGEKIDKILASMRQVAEGVPTTQSAFELSQKLGVSMPITEAAYHILYKDKDPGTVYGMLMHRDMKFESDD